MWRLDRAFTCSLIPETPCASVSTYGTLHYHQQQRPACCACSSGCVSSAHTAFSRVPTFAQCVSILGHLEGQKIRTTSILLPSEGQILDCASRVLVFKTPIYDSLLWAHIKDDDRKETGGQHRQSVPCMLLFAAAATRHAVWRCPMGGGDYWFIPFSPVLPHRRGLLMHVPCPF